MANGNAEINSLCFHHVDRHEDFYHVGRWLVWIKMP